MKKPVRFFIAALPIKADRTYHYWHASGARAARWTDLRLPRHFRRRRARWGQRFDPDKVLLDPYGRAVALPPGYSRTAVSLCGTTASGNEERRRRQRARTTGRTISRCACPRQTVTTKCTPGLHPHPNSGVHRWSRPTPGVIENIPCLTGPRVTAVECADLSSPTEADWSWQNQLLGLPANLVFCPVYGLQFGTEPIRCA